MTFPWNRAESQLNREIAHHLQQLTDEYLRQGYTREEAARQARKDFGGAEQFKEECRDERRFAWLPHHAFQRCECDQHRQEDLMVLL